ncbi:MAG: putative oxidoreductase [Flavobacteriales bacterium]
MNSVFQQIKEGKLELTFGYSEIMAKATPEVINATFKQMNP